MLPDIPGPNALPKFYGEIPGIIVPGEGIPYQVKADSFESVSYLCDLMSAGIQYFYIVEAYPDLRRGDPQTMPNSVDVIRLSVYNITGELNFPPPSSATNNIITDCPTIEDFVLNYRRQEKFQQESTAYKWAIVYGHYHDILTKGHTYVSRHDNVTGEFLTYAPSPEIFKNIAMQFQENGLVRTKFEISERLTNQDHRRRTRCPNRASLKAKR